MCPEPTLAVVEIAGYYFMVCWIFYSGNNCNFTICHVVFWVLIILCLTINIPLPWNLGLPIWFAQKPTEKYQCFLGFYSGHWTWEFMLRKFSIFIKIQNCQLFYLLKQNMFLVCGWDVCGMCCTNVPIIIYLPTIFICIIHSCQNKSEMSSWSIQALFSL